MRISDWSSDVCSSDLPDMIFVRPTTILVFDRLADELFLIAPIWPDTNGAIDRMIDAAQDRLDSIAARSEEHTSELKSLMRISYAVFCLKKTIETRQTNHTQDNNRVIYR